MALLAVGRHNVESCYGSVFLEMGAPRMGPMMGVSEKNGERLSWSLALEECQAQLGRGEMT